MSSAVTVRCTLVTVNVAALEVAVAGVHELVNTAWYWFPLMATVGLLMVNVVLVASGISLKLTPLLVLTCHCTVGAGLPPAAAVKLTLATQ